MKRVNFSDWQEMALKKDVEQIKKKITSQESILFSVWWELVLALGSILIDYLFDKERIPGMVWIFIIIGAILPAVVVLGRKAYIWIQSILRVKSGKFKVREFVDSFDNEISYWVMLSNSYTEMITEDENIKEAELEFLYREGCYYNNKSMHTLYMMKSNFDKIFTFDHVKVRKENLVDMERLFNILDVMNAQQLRLEESVKELESNGIKRQRELNSGYLSELKKFLNDLNALAVANDRSPFEWKIESADMQEQRL